MPQRTGGAGADLRAEGFELGGGCLPGFPSRRFLEERFCILQAGRENEVRPLECHEVVEEPRREDEVIAARCQGCPSVATME